MNGVIIRALFLSLVTGVAAEGGMPEMSWWIYIVVTLFVIAIAASITFCCCGCCGRFACEQCQEDPNKEVTPEDVILSQMGNNPYTNFQNSPEDGGTHRADQEEPIEEDIDLEEGKEVIQYEWGKDDSHTPMPYAL